MFGELVFLSCNLLGGLFYGRRVYEKFKKLEKRLEWLEGREWGYMCEMRL